MSDYHYQDHLGQTHGPVSKGEIMQLVEEKEIKRNTFVFREGDKEWREANKFPEFWISRQKATPAFTVAPVQKSECSRGTYIVLGLFLGGLGIHNFYAGRLKPAATQLILMLTLFWTIVVPIVVLAWVVTELFNVTADGAGRPFKVAGI